MDLDNLIEQLRAERNRLTGIINTLERLGQPDKSPIGPQRRGRRFMDEKDRQAVSERMKRYWARRRKERKPAEADAKTRTVAA